MKVTNNFPAGHIGVAGASALTAVLAKKLKASVASRVNTPCQQRKLYQVPKKHSMTQIVYDDQNIDGMGKTPKPNLTLNQIKRLELIRSAIINIQDSPEFARLDYYPDLTLGDATQAIEELIIECERDKPVKTIKWTVSPKFDLVKFLSKSMITSFFVCGFFACGALFSNGLNEINRTRFSIADQVDWESLGEVSTGVSMVSLAISAGCALTAVALNAKE